MQKLAMWYHLGEDFQAREIRMDSELRVSDEQKPTDSLGRALSDDASRRSFVHFKTDILDGVGAEDGFSGVSLCGE